MPKQPYDPFKKKYRTVRVICVNCRRPDNVTLFGLPSEFRKIIEEARCKHCGTIGQLATSQLAKTRTKSNTGTQLAIKWGK